MDGGCYCGGVRYRLDGEPQFVNTCHCRDCQKLSGSAFAVNAGVARDQVTVTAGAPTENAGAASCPDCHVLLWATHPKMGADTLFLRAGTLDEGEAMVPTAHFFVRSKHPWVTIPEGVPAYQTLPGA